MTVSELKKMMDDGALHNEYVERHGCKRFEVANNVNAVLVYSSVIKSGDRAGGKGKWTLSRIGVADKTGMSKESTLFMATFHEPLPENGTPVILYGVEYDENEGKNDRTYGNFNVSKVIVVGEGNAAPTDKPKTSNFSASKDHRIWNAGCINTAIAKVGLLVSSGVLPVGEMNEEMMDKQIDAAIEWAKLKNPLDS